MRVRMFVYNVSVEIEGHPCSEWEFSRDKEGARVYIKDTIESNDMAIQKMDIASSWDKCSKCNAQMNLQDNFCGKCGEKA